MNKPVAFGKYFLLERISIGGMAEVFRAKAFGVEGFERLVAVKRILPNVADDKEFIRAFIEEAKLSVQLNHANVAQIFDLGVVDGSYYVALEHIYGRDLRAIFDRSRELGEPMQVAQACFIAMKVCEGLDYAHNKRDPSGTPLALVHRDVSPQNILISFEGEVKLIDFGIAKAAGTGPKIASGILKGKLGYMSPEQVRGLPVDRRSDVFSCGVVLYELLTGERLFAGDTDLATLDKVKNVEILPPSTYNRKIPDELERIVLKALSKDYGDRYQNAIDLHDELQAFVYTAGEFYSRKDLGGWMKKTFAQEIEDETAKLESYRQLKPPPPETVAPAPAPAASPPPRAATSTKPAHRTTTEPFPHVKPPPPRTTTEPLPQVKPPPTPPVSRPQPVPVAPILPTDTPPPPEAPVEPPSSVPVQKLDLGIGMISGQLDPSAIGWEDDEVETQLYVDQDKSSKHKPAQRQNLPLTPPVASSPEISLITADVEISDTVQADILSITLNPSAAMRPTPTEVSTDSDDLPAPPKLALHGEPRPIPRRREISAPSRLISPSHPRPDLSLDPMATFGARITGTRRPATDRPRSLLVIALGGAAAVVIAAIAVVALSGGSTASPSRPVVTKPQPVVAAADPSTGFDLYVTPSGVMQWKLDGESRTDRLPSRIRGITAGQHTVHIEPPPGFLSQVQQVTVDQGKAPKVEIKLQPIPGISGTFESSPPGATISLIIDGKRQTLGPSPAKAPLDPRSGYQVLFEKPGYVSVNRPIQFSGSLDERIIVSLEKASPDTAAARPTSAPAADPKPQRRPKPVEPADRPAAAPASDDEGVLVLGSKPPCEILVDGSSTGLRTPQTGIKLPVGRHRITLVNAEFSIRETFTVDIKADAPEKMIKDYSDRLPH